MWIVLSCEQIDEMVCDNNDGISRALMTGSANTHKQTTHKSDQLNEQNCPPKKIQQQIKLTTIFSYLPIQSVEINIGNANYKCSKYEIDLQ